MEYSFKNLTFEITDGRIFLRSVGNVLSTRPYVFSELQLAGNNKDNHLGIKQDNLSESTTLKFLEKKEKENFLEIIQGNNQIEISTFFTFFNNAVSVSARVKNISNEDIIIEEIPTLKLMGFGNNPHEVTFTRFTSCHQGECQPLCRTFAEYGLFGYTGASQKSIQFSNIGSWSTKEELPQGIIARGEDYTMFQIESNNSWHYEISDKCEDFYLSLGGGSINHGSWYKKLKCGECYDTVKVALAFGNSLNEVLGAMTEYRRTIKGKCRADENLPTIFNEYMHLSWDSPTAENTAKIAPTIADMGAEYYVIDCGWHNEEDGNIIYPFVGQWKESKKRFPEGLRKTTDFIRSLGMKAGLWIEPEIIGIKCAEMLDYYDDDCFITRFGKKIAVMNRYFLDFRNEKVRKYLTESIDRMVNVYGAEYIKMDYNEDMGIGTDKDSDSFGEGLEKCAEAYLSWVEELRAKYPDILFETCSSGGMRMDYKTLSRFSIVSTSDQTNYKKYPCIAGTILSAVLPEQAAVWSYPVDSYGEPNSEFSPTTEWVNEHISEEQVIMNMINAMLGRIHLASHLELLDERKTALVKEGMSCYKSLCQIKKEAKPFFPLGLCKFEDKRVACGLKKDNKIYLSAYNLGGEDYSVNMGGKIKNAKILYPLGDEKVKLTCNGEELKISFDSSYQARFIEVEVE